jgi:hypothetical protein
MKAAGRWIFATDVAKMLQGRDTGAFMRAYL